MGTKSKSEPQSAGKNFDLVVIGAGSAGVHAAVQASKLQKRVAIVERDPSRVGGAWIHTGTLPSKTLREALDAVHSIRFHVGAEWVNRVVHELSAEVLFGRARTVARQEQELVEKHLAANQITVIRGEVSFEDPHTVRVNGKNGSTELVRSEKFLIATGSRPRRPDGIPFDGWRIVDSDDVLTMEKLPRRMVIYGAGVIGCEYACIFQAAGCQVILADERNCMMQSVDQEVTNELQRAMRALGVDIRLGAKLTQPKTDGAIVKCNLGTEMMTVDCIFYAAGRVSNSEHLGLERIGIKVNDRGAILVNSDFQTDLPHIYAAGDVIGAPALAATSAQQGRFASCHMFGIPQGEFPRVFPIGVYTIPELSSVGISEEEATKQKLDFVVGRAGFGEIARGYIRGDQHGILKLIISKTDQKILGIHITGDGACNLVHIGMAFMLKGGCAQDLVRMVFNYPTLAEAYRVAAFNALNKIFKDGKILEPGGSTSTDAPSTNRVRVA